MWRERHEWRKWREIDARFNAYWREILLRMAQNFARIRLLAAPVKCVVHNPDEALDGLIQARA